MSMTGVTDAANAAEQAAAWLDQNEPTIKPTEQIPYTLRVVTAADIIPMTKIIRKIGLKDIGKSFAPTAINSITARASGESADQVAETVGIEIVLNIADVIMENLEGARQEIFAFLGGLSGMTAEEVGSLPLNIFAEMVLDVFQAPEFMGFIKVVLRSIK